MSALCPLKRLGKKNMMRLLVKNDWIYLIKLYINNETNENNFGIVDDYGSFVFDWSFCYNANS